jgi:hypothetical protein
MVFASCSDVTGTAAAGSMVNSQAPATEENTTGSDLTLGERTYNSETKSFDRPVAIRSRRESSVTCFELSSERETVNIEKGSRRKFVALRDPLRIGRRVSLIQKREKGKGGGIRFPVAPAEPV